MSSRVEALILTGQGNAPVRDPGWPVGALEVANLPARVGWAEGPPFGGGQWTFYYRGDQQALDAALEAFLKVSSERLEVELHEGVGETPFLRGGQGQTPNGAFDWSFEVWVPENWKRLYHTPENGFWADHPDHGEPVAPPRLDLWLAPGASELRWEMPKNVPGSLLVRDQRASSHGFARGSGSVVRVTGRDAQTGKPISALRVTALLAGGQGRWEKAAEARGNEPGRVELAGLRAGGYRFVLGAPGYVDRSVEYERVGNNDFREYTCTLARPGALRGTVQDRDGKGLPQVKLTVRRALGPDGKGYPLADAFETVSDAQGRYRFDRLPVGRADVGARLTGFHQVWQPSSYTPVVEPNATASTTQTIVMERTGALAIQFVDADGQPLHGPAAKDLDVHVESERGAVVGSWGGSARVGEDGRYVFEEVPPGRYRVSSQPFLPGGSAASASAQWATVERGKRVEVELMRP